jgi:hypothetical protein
MLRDNRHKLGKVIGSEAHYSNMHTYTIYITLFLKMDAEKMHKAIKMQGSRHETSERCCVPASAHDSYLEGDGLYFMQFI